MKYTKWLAITLTLICCLASSLPYIDYVGAQDKVQKFRMAPSNAKKIEADHWTVTLVEGLSEKEFESELERILITYDAKLLPPDPTTKRPYKDWGSHFAGIQVPEERAKQIAEDKKVIEVAQIFTPPPSIPPVPEQRQIRQNAPGLKDALDPRRDEKKEKPEQDETGSIGLKSNPIAANRNVIAYNLDRIDRGTAPYNLNGVYEYTNAGDGVDIYFFDGGLNTAHVEFDNRAIMQINRWPEDYFLPSAAYPGGDHGTNVVSQAIGRTVGTAAHPYNSPVSLSEQVRAYMIRINRFGPAPDKQEGTPYGTYAIYINQVRDLILARRPRRAIISISTIDFDTNVTQAPRTALTNLMNTTNTPVFVAVGQATSIGPKNKRSDYWPPNHPGVMAVGMTDSRDHYVNYVYINDEDQTITVDHFAGADILAPAGPRWINVGTTSEQVLQDGIVTALADGSNANLGLRVGTSLAAPMVAGVAAMYLSVNKTYIPDGNYVKQWLIDHSTKGAISTFFMNDDPNPENRLVRSNSSIAINRNSASFTEGCAPDSLATAFGGFGGGAPDRVDFVSSNNSVLATSVPSFSNFEQANFYVPASLAAANNYAVKFYQGAGLLSSGPIQLNTIAPGIFRQQGGSGDIAAAHLYVTDKVTGVTTGPIPFNTGGNSEWNPAINTAIIVCYGTGWRRHNGINAVRLSKDGTVYQGGSAGSDFNLYYVGCQNDGVNCIPNSGLDQFNIGPLPEAMYNKKGNWGISLYVSGLPGAGGTLANVVAFRIN